MPSNYITAKEITEEMPISEPTAYRIIKNLNDELKEQGFLTINGKCPRTYFYQRFNIQKEKDVSTVESKTSNQTLI